MAERQFAVAHDWRSDEAYEALQSLPPTGWAWEFLRRNEAFQNDWQNWRQQQRKAAAHTENGVTIYRIEATSPAAKRWGLVGFPFCR